MHSDVIFREYDIRGVYNKDFDTDFARSLARGFVSYIFSKTGQRNPKISVGYDARLSSLELIEALTQGFVESGADVQNLGLVTTPMCYFSTFETDVAGAIQVTGSHNPPEYNGFKISLGRSTIFGAEIRSLGKIIATREFLKGHGTVNHFDVSPKYLSRYQQEFGTLKDISVVLDCGNGSAGSIVRKLFNAVGLNPKILFEEPDGRFPNHHPDPTVEENLEALKTSVLENNALCGIGFDGDADRIGVVDHKGKMIYGDELMVVFARSILAANPGQKIVGDVKCSDRLYRDIKDRGGIPIMWKTGHSLVKEKIKIEKAPFGGEMSGHIFFADRNYGYDDAPYAALRLCEILSNTGKTIDQLLAGLPSSFNTPEIRIDTTEEKKTKIVQKIKESFPQSSQADYKVDLTDGIRLSFNDGWALCRASNTQPVLVLRFESNTQEGLSSIRKRIEPIVENLIRL